MALNTLASCSNHHQKSSAKVEVSSQANQVDSTRVGIVDELFGIIESPNDSLKADESSTEQPCSCADKSSKEPSQKEETPGNLIKGQPADKKSNKKYKVITITLPEEADADSPFHCKGDQQQAVRQGQGEQVEQKKTEGQVAESKEDKTGLDAAVDEEEEQPSIKKQKESKGKNNDQSKKVSSKRLKRDTKDAKRVNKTKRSSSKTKENKDRKYKDKNQK